MVNSIYQILLLGCNKELLPVVRSKLEKSLSDMQNAYQMIYQTIQKLLKKGLWE